MNRPLCCCVKTDQKNKYISDTQKYNQDLKIYQEKVRKNNKKLKLSSVKYFYGKDDMNSLNSRNISNNKDFRPYYNIDLNLLDYEKLPFNTDDKGNSPIKKFIINLVKKISEKSTSN